MIPIPPEITNIIIENTQAGPLRLVGPYRDKRTLVSCTLVCQCWRPLAQVQLFKDVHFFLDGDRPLDQFLAFLHSAPHLARAIRQLYLGLEQVTIDVPPHPMCPVSLMNIAAVLSPEAHLMLYIMTLLGWPSDTPLPTAPVKLRRLTLSGVFYEPFACPHSMAFDISSFFELDEILFEAGRMVDRTDDTLSNVRYDLWSYVPSDVPYDVPYDLLVLPVATRPTARSVKVLGRGDCFAACNFQCGGFNPEQLEVMHFAPVDLATLRFAGRMLRLHGPSLHNVELDVSGALNGQPPENIPRFWGAFSIASCTHIETLCLSWDNRHSYGFLSLPPRRPAIPNEYDARDMEACGAFGTILGSTSRTLRKLTFNMPYMQGAGTLTDALRYLAPHIKRAVDTFSKLETVTLTFTRWFAADEATNVMHSMLPTALLDSGKLRVEHSPYPFPYDAPCEALYTPLDRDGSEFFCGTD